MRGKVWVAMITSLLLAPVLIPYLSQAEEVNPAEVSILYFNDGHEIAPVKDNLGTRGGVARIKTVVDSVPGHKIVAFGGDIGGGTLFGGVFKGHPMVEAFNQIPIDVANFGQHDFDAGTDNTRQLVHESQFTWITSNLTTPEGTPFANAPTYRIYEKQGIRIGVIGLTSAMDTTTKDPAVIQQNVIDSAKKAVEQMKRDQQVDVIVALTQETVQDDKELLKAVPDIRAIFTEEEAEEQSFVYDYDGTGSRFIFSPQGNMGSVIKLDIRRSEGGFVLSNQVIKVDENVKEDEALNKLAASYQAKLEEELGRKIAVSKSDLVYGENHESRFMETNIGNWIADSYRDYYGVEIAFANGGGIRASAKQGDLTLKDAKSILPFGNKIVVAEVDGTMVQAALENGVAKVNQLAGAFLQVSGLSYEYYPSKPVGKRVMNVMVNGKPLVKDQTYKLALSNFMYTGGDNYTMFQKAKTLVGPSEALSDAEILIQYAKKKGVVDVKPEGRIKVHGFIDLPGDHWATAAVTQLADRQIVEGVTDHRFVPGQPITRAQFAVLLVRAAGIKGPAAAPIFSDVPPNSWYAGAINSLAEKGLVTGKGPSTFGPDDSMTREEMAVLMRRAYEWKSGQKLLTTITPGIRDAGEISSWAQDSIYVLMEKGLFSGRTSDAIQPREKASRAESAQMIWNIMNK
jgi:2',3'-cyclic-nucleotide 2'-phosphodiesterase (5'-nucleotidase family)